MPIVWSFAATFQRVCCADNNLTQKYSYNIDYSSITLPLPAENRCSGALAPWLVPRALHQPITNTKYSCLIFGRGLIRMSMKPRTSPGGRIEAAYQAQLNKSGVRGRSIATAFYIAMGYCNPRVAPPAPLCDPRVALNQFLQEMHGIPMEIAKKILSNGWRQRFWREFGISSIDECYMSAAVLLLLHWRSPTLGNQHKLLFRLLQVDAGLSHAATALALDHAGERLLVGDAGGEWQCRDTMDFRTSGEQSDPIGSIRALAFSPLGSPIRAGVDSSDNLWCAVHECVSVLLNPAGPVSALALSPDGTCIAFARPNGKLSWSRLNCRVGDVISSVSWTETCLDVTLSALTWNPCDGTLLGATADGQIWHWDLSITPPNRLGKLGANISAIAISPDGKKLAAALEHGELAIWDLACPIAINNPISVAIPSLGSEVTALALSQNPPPPLANHRSTTSDCAKHQANAVTGADSKVEYILASATLDGLLALWDISRRPFRELHRRPSRLSCLERSRRRMLHIGRELVSQLLGELPSKITKIFDNPHGIQRHFMVGAYNHIVRESILFALLAGCDDLGFFDTIPLTRTDLTPEMPNEGKDEAPSGNTSAAQVVAEKPKPQTGGERYESSNDTPSNPVVGGGEPGNLNSRGATAVVPQRSDPVLKGVVSEDCCAGLFRSLFGALRNDLFLVSSPDGIIPHFAFEGSRGPVAVRPDVILFEPVLARVIEMSEASVRFIKCGSNSSSVQDFFRLRFACQLYTYLTERVYTRTSRADFVDAVRACLATMPNLISPDACNTMNACPGLSLWGQSHDSALDAIVKAVLENLTHNSTELCPQLLGDVNNGLSQLQQCEGNHININSINSVNEACDLLCQVFSLEKRLVARLSIGGPGQAPCLIELQALKPHIVQYLLCDPPQLIGCLSDKLADVGLPKAVTLEPEDLDQLAAQVRNDIKVRARANAITPNQYSLGQCLAAALVELAKELRRQLPALLGPSPSLVKGFFTQLYAPTQTKGTRTWLPEEWEYLAYRLASSGIAGDYGEIYAQIADCSPLPVSSGLNDFYRFLMNRVDLLSDVKGVFECCASPTEMETP